MKHDLKQIAAVAALTLAGSAHALVLTAGGPGLYDPTLSQAGIKLSFSSDVQTAFDTLKVTVQGSGLSSVVAPKDTDGYYVDVSVTTPITTATFDDTTGTWLGLTSTGGATYVSPALRNVSTGGSLTVTDLSVDLVDRKVYSDLVGANGLGTLTHVALFNIGSFTTSGPFQPCYLDGVCSSIPSLSISGLSWTSEGRSAFSQGLGLVTLGISTFQILDNLGTLQTTTTSLPEPSSYALMGLGLAGIWAARLRRHLSRLQ